MENQSKTEKLRCQMTSIFLLAMFIVHPVFTLSFYFNISQNKWTCLLLLTLGYAFLILLCTILDDKMEKAFLNIVKGLSLPYFALIGFVVVNTISTLLSDYTNAAMLGNQGRYHGLSTMIAYLVILLLLRPNLTSAHYEIKIFTMTAAAINIFSIAQYLTLDPLGFYKDCTEKSIHYMISTIGNRNIYASFLSMVVPLTIVFFVKAEKLFDKILFGAFIAFGFAGAICSNSDSFYIGLFAGLIIFILAGNNTVSEYLNLLLAGAIGLFGDGVLLVAAGMLRRQGRDVRPSEGITKYLDAHTSLPFILGATLLALYIVLTLVLKKYKDILLLSTIKQRIISGCVLAAGCFGSLLALLLNYPYNPSWGSFRGFIWNLSLRDFGTMNSFHKLFGYGPETILMVYKEKYHQEMVTVTGVIYDNVHSEPLEYLMTSGLLGIGFYLLFVISALVLIYKLVPKDKTAIYCLVPAFAYFIQSFVNIAQASSTPYFFIFLIIGVALCNNNQKEKEA